eukprot:11686941-Heterocapsa_arctica.AAC.1
MFTPIATVQSMPCRPSERYDASNCFGQKARAHQRRPQGAKLCTALQLNRLWPCSNRVGGGATAYGQNKL